MCWWMLVMILGSQKIRTCSPFLKRWPNKCRTHDSNAALKHCGRLAMNATMVMPPQRWKHLIKAVSSWRSQEWPRSTASCPGHHLMAADDSVQWEALGAQIQKCNHRGCAALLESGTRLISPSEVWRATHSVCADFGGPCATAIQSHQRAGGQNIQLDENRPIWELGAYHTESEGVCEREPTRGSWCVLVGNQNARHGPSWQNLGFKISTYVGQHAHVWA